MMQARQHIQMIVFLLLAGVCVHATRAEVFIDQSHEAQAMLTEMRTLIADHQWQQVEYLANQLLENHADHLVPIQPYRFVPVIRMLSGLAGRTPELRAILQTCDASRASAALDEAGDDPAKLRQVVERFGWTASGQQAGLRAAGIYLERAEFDRAARVLAEVLQSPEPDGQQPARVLAATAAIYTRDMTGLREQAMWLRRQGAGAELTRLRRLAESILPGESERVMDRPSCRLSFDEASGPSAQPQVLNCLPMSRGPARWSMRPRQLHPEWKNAQWGGRPLLIDDQAYVPVRVTGPANLLQVFVAALNIQDGSLIWARRVYSRTVDRRADPARGMCELVADDDSIYAWADERALSRVYLADGSVRWVSLANETVESGDEPDAVSPWVRQRIVALPAGLVVIAPERHVLIYDPRDGQVVRRINDATWRHPMHLRATDGGVMAFGDRIVRIDGQTLEPTWVSPEPFDPRSFQAEPDREDYAGPRRTRSIRDSVGGRVGGGPLNGRVPARRVR